MIYKKKQTLNETLPSDTTTILKGKCKRLSADSVTLKLEFLVDNSIILDLVQERNLEYVCVRFYLGNLS